MLSFGEKLSLKINLLNGVNVKTKKIRDIIATMARKS
jgi:hypothetical protein